MRHMVEYGQPKRQWTLLDVGLVLSNMLEWVQNQANRVRIDNPIRRRQTMGDRIVGNDHVAITGRETGIKVTIDQVWEERRGHGWAASKSHVRCCHRGGAEAGGVKRVTGGRIDLPSPLK